MKTVNLLTMALVAMFVSVSLFAGDKDKDCKKNKTPVKPAIQNLVVTPSEGTLEVDPNTIIKISVCLPTAPKDTVHVKARDIDGDRRDHILFIHRELKFTKMNWDKPQSIIVHVGKKARDDTMKIEADGYNDVIINFVVQEPTLPELIITPNDDPIKVYPNTENKVSVSLPAMPKNNVTVKVYQEGDEDTGFTFSTESLKFTKKNWNIPQVITVKVAENATEATMVLDAKGYEIAAVNFVDPPVPVFNFVGTWDESYSLTMIPGMPPMTQTNLYYTVNEDGTCGNYNPGNANPIRTGTWTVEDDGSISIAWADGNSATLTFTDADNMTGISGLDAATITLTRQ